MTGSNRNLNLYSTNLWLMLVVLVGFIASFVFYVSSEKQIGRANETRQQSILLAEELRNSSDDLTRMVRTYVVTGHPLYKRHFQEILDIRDGKTPRPVGYQSLYWDLVLLDDQRPSPFGEALPLLELMRRAGFTEEEFKLLKEAKSNSDALTRAEYAAMALVETDTSPSESIRIRAIQMLHDPAYHQAKLKIMQPISQFRQMVDQRTLESVHAAERRALSIRLVLILFGVLQLILLWRAQRYLFAVLGAPLHAVYRYITELGGGNYTTTIPVPKGREDSVVGWLSEM